MTTWSYRFMTVEPFVMSNGTYCLIDGVQLVIYTIAPDLLPFSTGWPQSTSISNQFLQQPPPEIRHQTVPKGRKDNSYCVVDNTVNTERPSTWSTTPVRRRLRRLEYQWWVVCSFPYVVSSAGLQRVFLHDGQYCRERKSTESAHTSLLTRSHQRPMSSL